MSTTDLIDVEKQLLITLVDNILPKAVEGASLLGCGQQKITYLIRLISFRSLKDGGGMAYKKNQ